VNFPAAVAEAAGLQKGEEMEWLLEDRNIFVLKRTNKAPTNLPPVTGERK
jgi:antitoxin component of MazEF toxin-antitoxin module